MRKLNKNKKSLVFRRWSRKSYAIFNSLHKEVKIGVLALSCSLVCMNPQKGMAQTADTTIVYEGKALEEIVISDDMPNLQTPPQVVAVIQKDEIERAAVQNLQDLLHYVQGVDLRSRGTEGVQADISLRGGTFDQTTILLNGINFSDPQTGHYSFNLPINLKSIERIEIIQEQNNFSVAGSAVFSGAINIVTKKDDSHFLQFDASGGQYGYYQLGLWTGKNFGKWWVSLSGNFSSSDGYAPNTDFNIGNLFVETSFRDSKIGTFDFQAGFQSKEFGANSFYSPKFKEQYDENKVFISSLKYNKRWGRWHNESAVYYRRHHDNFTLFRYDENASHNYHLTDVWGVFSQFGYRWKAGITGIGADFRSEHISSSNLGEPLDNPKSDPYDDGLFKYAKSRELASFFLRHTIEKEKWKLILGIMESVNGDYGANTYWNSSFSYSFLKELSLTAWAQQSYRMPTFTDLYYKSPAQIGNPDLLPENIIATEISLKWNPQQWTLGLTPFYRYGFRIIDWVRLPQESIWYSRNETDLQTSGVEVSAAYLFKHTFLQKIHLSYMWMTQSKNSNQYLSLYATDYLRNQLKLSVAHKIWNALSASWLFSLQDRAGTYLDINTNQETLYKPYLLCDLKISWEKKYYVIAAEISNLFNTEYSDIGNIPQAGIWAKLHLTIRL